MASTSELKRRRDKAREREAEVEAKIRQDRLRKDELEAELKEEREEREQLRDKRDQIKTDLEAEAKADEKEDGEHGEGWEQRKEEKLDEVADLYEASEARSDRLAKKIIREDKELAEHLKAEEFLEGRIERLTKQIVEAVADEAGQLTKDFHIREFDCRNGTKVPPYMEDDLRELCRQHLQPLRDSGGGVTINSGFRTQAYNASIGGASNSYHIYDLRKKAPAADHTQAGRPAPAVYAWHESHNPPDGMGRYSSFTHIDDRGYRSRWTG